jgi:general secretion pathway protein E
MNVSNPVAIDEALSAADDAPTELDLAAIEPLGGMLTREYLELHAVLPIRRTDAELNVATWREAIEIDVQVLDDLCLIAGAPEARIVRLPEASVRAAIRRTYGEEAATAQGMIASLDAEQPVAVSADIPLDDLVHLAYEAPVIKLVNLLVLEALESRASDVHLEGYADQMRVRYRIDGVLQDAPSPPQHLTAAVVSRIKIMADLDIAERRAPQDGRIRLRLQARDVDVRVSTLPTLHGESVVLRLLDKDRGRIDLAELGMAAETLGEFVKAIERPHGIVLATGPTGSGKTTTLYAAIDRIRTGREKILTVEDPVEYQLAGVPQVAVNEKAGVTFATALRALLRQDPDVMLVGEIRDAETAEIATQAALTGHLVLSTLHTNDAVSALTRLVDLEVAPFLVASTVESVLGQRLLRVICPACREEYSMPAPERERLATSASVIDRAFRGRGCDQCRGTGYRGRTGIYELLVVDDEMRVELQRSRSASDLRVVARSRGMRSLRDDGLRLLRAGITTIDELLRVTQA